MHYHNAPGWGTNQFAFGAPPALGFQPLSTWGGMDFYRAHAYSPDMSLYQNAWNRVRNWSPSAGMGVGIHEAQHWHQLAYGGLRDLGLMLPDEIGHAAAYEAYRSWIHNSSMYEPYLEDLERQREGMIGLAIAEATRMLQYAGRPYDQFARMGATEAAAATASMILYQRTEMDGHGPGRFGMRGSFSGYSPDMFDPYSFDDIDYPYRRSRSRSRHRRSSYDMGYGVGYAGGGYAGGGYAGGGYAGGGYAGGGYMGGGYMGGGYTSGGFVGPYGSAGMPYSYGQGQYGYPGSLGGMGYGGYASSYGSAGIPVAPGSQVILSTSSSGHKHRSRSRHGRSRSRSRSGSMIVGSVPSYASSYML